MGVPATTGQLRTKVSEMEIGDYIRFVWDYGTWANSFLSNDDTITECNVIGESIASGQKRLYLVKVAKGLLVADRVVRHSLAWDSINSFKYIQGIPYDNGNITPTMTSNTSPSGVASASSESSSFLAWKAFDKSTGYWMMNAQSGWLSYEFVNPTKVKSYALTAPSDVNFATRSPKDWTFEGWDGSQWVILDTRTGVSDWTSGARKSFLINNSQEFLKYRVNILINNGNAYTYIGELEMFDTVGIIRSLTGGVAYADANVNKSLTDLGFGAFPTNNEWDKYIVNFPPELIQAGKALDDVFHWSNVATWCQETPINSVVREDSGTATNVMRTMRAGLNTKPINRFYFGSSNVATITIGFRPVFEYQE